MSSALLLYFSWVGHPFVSLHFWILENNYPVVEAWNTLIIYSAGRQEVHERYILGMISASGCEALFLELFRRGVSSTLPSPLGLFWPDVLVLLRGQLDWGQTLLFFFLKSRFIRKKDRLTEKIILVPIMLLPERSIQGRYVYMSPPPSLGQKNLFKMIELY